MKTHPNRLAPVLLFAGLALPAGAGHAAAQAAAPQRFYLSPGIRDGFAAMLERSPTFRRQCARIEDAGVVVSIRFRQDDVMDPRVDAFTRIVRSGRRVGLARIVLRPSPGWRTVLAHELEHIVEQVEGVDLSELATQRHSDVWRVGDAYETARAQLAGRIVTREMREHHPATVLALAADPPPYQ